MGLAANLVDQARVASNTGKMRHMAHTRELRPGEAISLEQLGAGAASSLHVRMTSTGELPDLVALLLGQGGKVRSDNDLVFYNNPSCDGQGVRWTAESKEIQWINVRTGEVGADVDRIIVAASDGALSFAAPASIDLIIADSFGTPLASAAIRPAAGLLAMILLEVYKRGETWRLRLMAQGYSAGLAALVSEFGVAVEDEEQAVEGSLSSPTNATWAPVPEPQLPPSRRPEDVILPPSLIESPVGARRGVFTSRRRAQLEAQNAELKRLLVTSGAMDNAAIDAERSRLLHEVGELTSEVEQRRVDIAALERRLADLRISLADAEGERELLEIGVYRYRHRLDDSVAYKAQLDQLRDQVRAAARSGNAVHGATHWTVNGSAVQGRKMVKELSKLMLRAYNSDADQAIRTLKPYKLDSTLARLDATRSTIARLGATMSIAVSDEYHRLRRSELELTADYVNKTEEEKERRRQLRMEEREQERVDAEYAREQARLERDRDKYLDALARLETSDAEPQKIAQVRSQLTSVRAALDQVAYRRANVRLGYVYVISNLGAFGERMVKIGMTRRVTPEDRIRELGDASVPFRFDTHALIFSEDAVALETALHQQFADRAVNRVNRQREFFYASPSDVRRVLEGMGLAENIVVHYDEQTPADEWRRSGGPDRAFLPT